MPVFGYRLTRETSHEDIRDVVERHIDLVFTAAVGHSLTYEEWYEPIIDLEKKANRGALHLVQEILNRLHSHPTYGTRFRVVPADTKTVALFVEGRPIQMAAYIIQKALGGDRFPSVATS